MIDNNNHGCLWYLQCYKMRSIASVSVFERLYVCLGIITYLDTAKGLKTAYRAFFIKTHIIDSWFFVPDCHYLGVWAFLSVVRYDYIPLTPKDAYMGKYGGIGEKTHNHYCISRWNTVSWLQTTKIELSPMGIGVLNGATTTDIRTIHWSVLQLMFVWTW